MCPPPPPLSQKDTGKVKKNTWHYRKRTLYLTIAYCMIAIAYIMFKSDPFSELQSAIANNLILLLGTTVGTFVFGQVADDNRDSFREDNDLAKWKERRLALMSLMSLCGIVVTYLIFKGQDSPLHQTLADGFCITFAGLHSTYVFSSVWEDSKLKEVFNESKSRTL